MGQSTSRSGATYGANGRGRSGSAESQDSLAAEIFCEKNMPVVYGCAITVPLVILAGLSVLIWWLVTREESQPFQASLFGILGGRNITYDYPCESNQCVYEFESPHAAEIIFNGAGNLTDTEGQPLIGEVWRWINSTYLKINPISTNFNEIVRVENDPARTLSIIAQGGAEARGLTTQSHSPAQ
jgi:hypothetical protein